MATDTALKSFGPDKQAWLGRVIGGKDLYDGSTGLTPTNAEGKPVDLTALQQEVEKYQQDLADGKTPSLSAEDALKKQLELRQFGIPSTADEANEFNAATEKREKALGEIRKLIEMEKDEIRNATDYKVVVKRRLEIGGHEFLYGSKTVVTKTKTGGVRGINKTYDSEADKEFDTEHFRGRVIEGPSVEQRKALNLVISQLELLTKKLQNNEEYDFSPQELMNEMWTPLVREGLISEDQCPEEFSRVLKLFQGASALYNRRLETHARKEVDKLEGARGHLDDFSEALGIGAAGADLVLSLVGGQGQAQQLLALSVKITQGTVKTASALMEKKANFKDAASSMGGVLEAVLGAAIGGKQGKEIGKLAKTGFMGCANLGLFAKRIAEREYDDGFDLLSDAVGGALDCIAGATGNKQLAGVGGHVSSGMKIGLKSGTIAYLLSQDPVDMDRVKANIKGIAQEAIKKGVREAIDKGDHAPKLDKKKEDVEAIKTKHGEDSEEYKKANAELEKLKKKQGDLITGLDKVFDGLFDGDKIVKSYQDKVANLAMEKGAEGAEIELIEENETFNKRLGIAFGMSIGADESDNAMLEDLYSIDALIVQIEKDRATLQMFNLIFDSVGAVVTMIIPQLGGPLKAKAFAMNVVAAAQRSHDLIQFTALVDDARKATSPQAPALLAEVDELKRHLTNDTLEAAIALGQAAGLTTAAAGDIATAAMGTGAVASTVGRAVSSGLDVFKKAKDLLKRKFEEKKTAKAWDMYVKALKNPKDRRHVLKTFRANPTLAKYSIAYGAIEMDDPIARETLRQLGLNDMTLAQENSNSDKVVMFLEAKFADDIVVEGVVSKFAPDLGDPLTLAVWVKNKEAAADPENVTEVWKTQKTNAIDAALIAVEDHASQVEARDLAKVFKLDEWNDVLAIWTAYIASLREFQTALTAFKPVTVDNQPFKRFQQYVNELSSIAEKKIQETEKVIATQKGVLTSRKTICQKTIDESTACVKAIDQGVPNLGTGQNRKIDEVFDLLDSGAGKTLLSSIKTAATDSPDLATHVAYVEHAFQFAMRRAKRAEKAWNKSPTAGNQAAGEAISRLLEDMKTAKESFDNAGKQAALDLPKYQNLAI